MIQEKFTGERFLPFVEDKKLQIEHFQRYLSVKTLAKGKRVLDAACGEGYGSSILAEVAKSVIGVDISQNTIHNAQMKYAQLENLRFYEASIADLSFIPTGSIDLLVSFETIEHVSEDVQVEFLKEASRVLTSNGILVMSTPNKLIYSDIPKYKNEFHVKEFYKNEFLEFLHSRFEYVQLFNQYEEVVSIIECPQADNTQIMYLKDNFKHSQDGKYYIAVASNVMIDGDSMMSMYIGDTPEYQKMLERIVTLQNSENERNSHIDVLNRELDDKGKRIMDLQEEIIARGEHNLHLDDIINRMQYEKNNLEQMLDILKSEKADLQQTILNKEGHIEQLLEVERAYEREKNTHSYKLGKKVQQLGDKILPPNSKRRFFTKVAYNAVRKPRLMLHVINPKRIKNYIKYMRLEGMEGVQKRYKEAVELEKVALYPESRLDINVVKVEKEQELKVEDFEKIVFPVWAEPEVSIVIPVYNEFHYTYNCLKSILKNSGKISYEIIIANDCSTDITSEIERIVENIKLITTEKNVRFLLNCNNAAKYAKGKYVLFLNNDTQVQGNWLEPLVTLIESDELIGMVGSKLVYPDGLLQEAGGIVWKDASAWNYGNRKNPGDAEFNYVKEVDYISGAAIMIRHNLWKEIGGFDERFVPAYYEDTDLAFEVRKRGYKVMYQPLSTVVHFEGVSNGTDTGSGLKQYQVVNFKKFYDKWKEILEAEHEVNGENVFVAKDRSNHKKHILVVDHYVPHHDQDAGGKCTYMYLKLFVKMGFKVTFIGDNFFKHEPYTTELNQMGIEVLYGNYYYNNWQNWLKYNGHYFDYVYLQRPHISVKYMDLVKKYTRAKVFYFAHDLHHVREYREYELTKDITKLDSSRNWKKIEYELFEKADVGHVVGSYEQNIMQNAFPNKVIRNIPLYMYETILDDINKDFKQRKDLLYVGGFGHQPNIDAVLWFAKEIFPEVVKRYPDIKWHVVGGKVPKDITELASENIIIEGFVDDATLEKLYRECRMAVVPLRFGAGVKGKVVEAAYFQIPLITTSIGAEGLSTSEGAMRVEDDAMKMAELICNVYEDYEALYTMSENAKEFTKRYFLLEEAERIIRLDIEI